MTTLETLAELNPAQRKALRKRFGSLSIVSFNKMDDLWHHVFRFAVTFEIDGKLVQYQGGVGPRGGLIDVKCVGYAQV